MIEIKFPRTQFDSLGRNGYTQSHGIRVSNLPPEIFLEPITSRGEIGMARLVVPLTHVAALRDALTAILPNGNLLFTADNVLRAGLAQAYRDGGYPEAESLMLEVMRNGLGFLTLELIPPENIGALTDAPIVAEADWPDDGETYGPVPYPDAPVWWFPNYAIIDPWEELKNKGRVVFTRVPEITEG